MKNIITISEDVPEHLVTYWVGILIGMGIPYKVNPKSPMYRVLQEYERELYLEGKEAREGKDKIPYNNMGYRVIHESGDTGALSVEIRNVPSEA